MEENNKVIVFEKKEIVLISLLVLVLIVTSFTIGVKMGKRISLDSAGVTTEDKKTVELKSTVEEDAEKTLSADAQLTDEEKLKRKQEEKELVSQWEKAIRKRKEKIQLAFDLGWIAKQHNKLQSQNPYSDDDELMQEWFSGYQKFSTKVK